MALKYHPDSYVNDDEKLKAQKIFVKLKEKYDRINNNNWYSRQR